MEAEIRSVLIDGSLKVVKFRNHSNNRIGAYRIYFQIDFFLCYNSRIKGVNILKTILLTGFEPFLDFPTNPTMQIAEHFNGQTFGEYTVHSRILKVDFAVAANELKEHMATLQPDIIISLGLAGGRYKITPERIAINVKDGAKDNNGYLPVDEPIDEASQDGYFSTLPIREIVNALQQAGYPAEISNTAGAYLCNNIMYEALRYSEGKQVKAGFIHIPASFELAIQHGKIPGWSMRDLIAAIQISIEKAVEDAL